MPVRMRLSPAQPRHLGAPLTTHSGAVLSVAFASDGRTLATSSNDQTVQLWTLDGLENLRKDPLESACSLTGHGLNADEWSRSVPGVPYLDSCAR
jgi:WD40 repeat protein